MPLLLLIVFAAAAALLVWRFARLRLALHRARQGEARLRLVADHSEEMSWSIDCASLQLLYASPAFERRFGIGNPQRQQVLAQLVHDLPARVARGAQDWRRLLRQFDLARDDGSVVPFEMSSSVLFDARGQPTELLGVLRDVSAERAQEQQWDQQCQRFASMLSHEFRNPLATIDGAIQNLEMRGGDGNGHAGGHPDDDTRKRYRKIAGAVERLLALLDDYLTPERMAGIGRARQPNAIAPRALLEGAAAQAVLNGQRITLHLSGLPASLRCDPEGMRLCLQVLLDNAVKYTPAGTHIVLSGGLAVHGGIEILVSDDGPGMVEDDLPRLFDKGYRGRNSGATSGSGLGLYMARAVLDVHGGTLSAQNRPEGGAAFRIWLPGAFEAGKSLAPGACSSDNSTTQAKTEPV